MNLWLAVLVMFSGVTWPFPRKNLELLGLNNHSMKWCLGHTHLAFDVHGLDKMDQTLLTSWFSNKFEVAARFDFPSIIIIFYKFYWVAKISTEGRIINSQEEQRKSKVMQERKKKQD